MNNHEKARMLLSKEILQNFIGRITGSGLDRIVGKNPENELLVGKLMSTQDDEGQDNRSSRTFISSIGTDFYVDESEIHAAEISLFPQGDFYFRALPTLEEQQAAFVDEANASISDRSFQSFDDVAAAYKEKPALFSSVQIKLIPVYKKVSISPEQAEIRFKAEDILDSTLVYGSITKVHSLNLQNFR